MEVVLGLLCDFKYDLKNINDYTEAYIILKNNEEYNKDIDCVNYIGWLFFSVGNFDKAIELFEMFENVSGESNLGLADISYLNNEHEKSYSLYSKSLSLGEYRSCYWLGFIDFAGLNGEKNIQDAMCYLRIGSDKGYLASKQLLNFIENDYIYGVNKLKYYVKEIKLLFSFFLIKRKDKYDVRLTDFKAFKKFVD